MSPCGVIFVRKLAPKVPVRQPPFPCFSNAKPPTLPPSWMRGVRTIIITIIPAASDSLQLQLGEVIKCTFLRANKNCHSTRRIHFQVQIFSLWFSSLALFVFFEYCGRTTSGYGVWGNYLQELKKSEIYIRAFRSISWWECCVLCTTGKSKQSRVHLAPQHKWELCAQTPVCSTLSPDERSARRQWQSQ